MRIRLVVALEPRQKLAQRNVRAPGRVECEARLEIGLRLAPQLLALTEHPQRVEERRVVVVLAQPRLGLLELACRVARAAFGVEQRELRIPVPLEAAGENVGGLAV